MDAEKLADVERFLDAEHLRRLAADRCFNDLGAPSARSCHVRTADTQADPPGDPEAHAIAHRIKSRVRSRLDGAHEPAEAAQEALVFLLGAGAGASL